MAQTKKRKRSSKHRGNAAGVVEARGRTGRKLTADERKKMGAPLTGEEKRRDRMGRAPTWQGATYRAAFAAVIFVIVLILLLDQSVASALGLGAFVLLFYIPLGFYTDKYLHERRQKKEQASGGKR